MPDATLPRESRDDVFDHVSKDICQSEVPSAGKVGEIFVVQAHQVQHRGPEIIDGGDLVHGVIAEIVRCAVDRAAFHTAARQPD